MNLMNCKKNIRNIAWMLILTLLLSCFGYSGTSFADDTPLNSIILEDGTSYTILEDSNEFRIVETNYNNNKVKSTYDKINNILTTIDYNTTKIITLDLNSLVKEQLVSNTRVSTRGADQPDPWKTTDSRYVNSPLTSFCYAYTIQKNSNTGAKIMQLQRRGSYTGWLSYGGLTTLLNNWESGVNAMYYDHVFLVASVPSGAIMAVLSVAAANPITAVAAAVIALGFSANVANKAWAVAKDRDNLDTIYKQIYR